MKSEKEKIKSVLLLTSFTTAMIALFIIGNRSLSSKCTQDEITRRVMQAGKCDCTCHNNEYRFWKAEDDLTNWWWKNND